MNNITIKNFKLYHLTSSNLPLGNFSYSQGLEWAVHNNWIKNVNTFRIWQKQQINHILTYVDLPILKRLYLSCKKNNIDNFEYWIYFLLANRETQELRQEEKQKGAALFNLIKSWELKNLNKNNEKWSFLIKKSYLGGLAWLSAIWNIKLEDIATSFTYNWIENAVMIGLKIVPFGQTKAHNLLKYFYGLMPKLLSLSFNIKNNDIGASLPLLSIASSRHETQYSRLFRS